MSPVPLDRLRSVAQALVTELPSLELLVLFGSVATGTERPDSDVDFGVRGVASWDGLRLGAELAHVLGREPHVVELDTASPVLRFEVAKTGQLIYETQPFTWARFQAEAMISFIDIKPLRDRCAEGVRRRLRVEAGLE